MIVNGRKKFDRDVLRLSSPYLAVHLVMMEANRELKMSLCGRLCMFNVFSNLNMGILSSWLMIM